MIQQYYREFFAFHYKQTVDRELALDLTQELFMTMLQSIGAYDFNKAAFRTWLYRLASNRLIDYYRSKQYKTIQLEEELQIDRLEEDERLFSMLAYKEDVLQITSILNRFDVQTQQVLRLRLFGEYQLNEIAELEKIPLSTVKTRYYAGVQKIRKEMRANDEGTS